MSLDEVQQNALQTYNENIEYFKQNHPDLYKNLELYAAAIELRQVIPQFELQYLGNYFDIVNPKTKQFLYAKNSNEISQSIVDGINFDATVNSFKTYYEHSYNDNIAKEALEQDILAPYNIGNAPIVNYVNKNLSNPQNLKDIHKFIIFGVLLGIHIPLIHQKLNSKVYLIVEPNLEFFRLSLFVTNYATLAKQTKLFFAVAQNEFEFKKTFDFFYGELFIFNHYLKFVNLSDSSKMYMTVIQNYLVSQPHILYSYDRTFLSLSRTNSYISQNFKLLNIKDKQNLKPFNKPVLLLAAGPSLQHNIEFVKKNQNYFTIVAIYATLPILEKNGIKPDIITQYDEQDVQVLNTLDKLNDINFFNDSIFLFASHVNAKLMNSFPKKNIFIFQAMFELKENFGILTSPSIGELSYALLLLFQAKEIYLLGLDLALDSETGKSHMEGHSGAGGFNELKELEESSDNNYSFRKNTIILQGNFIPEVKSVPVFKTSIDTFNQFTEMYKNKDCKVYNLSNGAYLNDTIPLRPTDINFSTFNENKKIILKKEIFDALANISETGYNDKDLEKLNLKLSSVKKIKKHIEQFQKIKKYKDFEEYKAHLINLIQNILFERHNCEDLQSILINFSSHNLHHIFYLFDLENDGDNKKYIYEINKNLCTQLNKIVDTYVVSISYSSDENSIALKKLNKYLKEYSIKNSIYSEPFFKELVETSKRGYQYQFEANSIGFFAIEDNLSNNNFISYIKEILKKFPTIKLKLFYFFDFQKVQAQFIFKQDLSRVELLIPHNINTIANNIDLWFDSYDKTINIKKLDDIILNNYENIYVSMFDNTIYEKELEKIKGLDKNLQIIPKKEKLALSNCLKEEYILPNRPYFTFANSFKYALDEEKIKNSYKKNTISFFAFRENLEKEFIKKIFGIAQEFPTIKFCIFYFDDTMRLEYSAHLRLIYNRCEFITPSNIYELIDNTELWVSANIKNKSFLYDKIENILDEKTYNCYSKVLEDDVQIIKNSETYIDSLFEDINDKKFIKHLLLDKVDEERLQNNSSKDTFGFLATEDNLEDDNFLKLMFILLERYPEIRYKAFYFNEKQKKLFENIFNDYLDKFKLILPKDIYEIINNISIYIYSYIPGSKLKTLLYRSLWQIFSKYENIIFNIHIYKQITSKDYYSECLNLYTSLEVEKDSNLDKLYKNLNKYTNSSTFNNENLNKKIEQFTPNTISFLGIQENFSDKDFINYFNNLIKKFPNTKFACLYISKNDINYDLITNHNNFSYIKINSFNELISSSEIIFSSINLKNTPIAQNLINAMLLNCNNVLNLIYNHKIETMTLKNSSNFKEYEIIENYKDYGLTQDEIKNSNYNHGILLYKAMYNLAREDINVDENSSLYNLLYHEFIHYCIQNSKIKHMFRQNLLSYYKYAKNKK